MQLLSNGDHIVVAGTIYGGTYALITEIMTRQGITQTFVCGSNMEHVDAAINENTRVSVHSCFRFHLT